VNADPGRVPAAAHKEARVREQAARPTGSPGAIAGPHAERRTTRDAEAKPRQGNPSLRLVLDRPIVARATRRALLDESFDLPLRPSIVSVRT